MNVAIGRLSLDLKELIRINVDRHGDIFRKRKFVQSGANGSAQAHNRGTAQEDVKTKLALQLLQRRRGRLTQCKLGADVFFQTSEESLGRELRSLLMTGTNR